MESVAAFVFASGGAVHPHELRAFFARYPAVHTAVLADGFPSTSLKKIVVKVGRQHGLFWCDDDPQSRARGPVVVHETTAAQREREAFDNEVQWVPRSLAALEQHVRTLPKQRMPTGAISAFYHAFPLETAFMKRRCGGVAAFVAHYDSDKHCLFVDERGSVCVRHGASSAAASDTRVATASHSRADALVECDDIKRELCTAPAPEPEDAVAPWRLQPSVASFWSLLARKAALVRPTPSASKDQIEVRAATLALQLSTGVVVDDCTSALSLACVSSKRAVTGTSLPLTLSLDLRALARVSQELSQVRAPPALHPLAFAIVVFERQQLAKRARKLARQALQSIAAASAAPALEHEGVCVARESSEEREDHFAAADISDAAIESEDAGECETAALAPVSLVTLLPRSRVAESIALRSRSASLVEQLDSRGTSAWTLLLRDRTSVLEVTVATVLTRVNEVLLSVRATPDMHPIASEITQWLERRMQQRRVRAMKARSRSQSQATPQLFGGMMRIVIPKATLEVLSCCSGGTGVARLVSA